MITLIKNQPAGSETVTQDVAEMPVVAPTVLLNSGLDFVNNQPNDTRIAQRTFYAAVRAVTACKGDSAVDAVRSAEMSVNMWGADCFVGMNDAGLSLTLPYLFTCELGPVLPTMESKQHDNVRYLTGRGFNEIDPRLAELFTNSVLLGIYAAHENPIDLKGDVLKASYLENVSQIIAMQMLALSGLGNHDTFTTSTTSPALGYYALNRLFDNFEITGMKLEDSIVSLRTMSESLTVFVMKYVDRFSQVDPESASLVLNLLPIVLKATMSLIQSGKDKLVDMPEKYLHLPVYRNLAGADYRAALQR